MKSAAHLEVHGETLLAHIQEVAKDLPHGQQNICSYIHTHYQEVAFQTVEELATASDTSTSSVVRVVKALGYSKYKDLQKDIRKILLPSNLSVWWDFDYSLSSKNIKSQDEHTLTWVARDNVETIQSMITPQLLEQFSVASAMLHNAERICIYGGRSTKAVVFYMYYLLQQISGKAHLLDAVGSGQIYEELINFTPKDVFVALSLGGPHFYSRTLDAMEVAANHGIPTLLITTHTSCPSIPYADTVLFVSNARSHYSIVSALTLVEALVVEFGRNNKNISREKLKKTENILVDYGVTR